MGTEAPKSFGHSGKQQVGEQKGLERAQKEKETDKKCQEDCSG